MNNLAVIFSYYKLFLRRDNVIIENGVRVQKTTQDYNDGTSEVTAEVNGFTEKTPNATLTLSRKEKTDTFEPNEISLFLSPLSKINKNSSFVEKNVKLLVTYPLKLGIMKAKPNADRTIGFTFDAAYNVESINVPNTWISYEMSYHFTMNP